jgi:hypothetical protein
VALRYIKRKLKKVKQLKRLATVSLFKTPLTPS